MSYFTTRQGFLALSFDLEPKEEDFLFDFLTLLELSGIGPIIEKHVKNDSEKGGRPNVNYYNLFATVLYAFAKGNDSLREIEEFCRFDLRGIYLMGQVRPDYSTIAKFFTGVIVPDIEKIFSSITNQICKMLDISLDDVFLDGSKFEANANKYKFVWKPLTYHRRLSKSFFDLVKQNGLLKDFHEEEFVRPSTITAAIDEFSEDRERAETKKGKGILKALQSMLEKSVEYVHKETICGEHRNSYYKTDHDATAMALKCDHYSGHGSNMHAAYNVQTIVAQGITLAYHVSQSRADIHDFIPVFDKFHEFYGCYPKSVCADSGYGSLENYEYLEKHGIENYVKYFSWEGNVSGMRPDNYRISDDMTEIICLNKKVGKVTKIEGRHPTKKNGVFFRIEGCLGCLFKDYCMRQMKDNENKNERVFEVDRKLNWYKQQGEKNLLSVAGIEKRVNRSIQVEGGFGNTKQNRDYDRFRRRGLKRGTAEIAFVFLGLNIRKYLNYKRRNKKPRFWKAPPTLVPGEFKKPSWKKLSKKGKKEHEKIYKNKTNQQA